MTGKTCRAAEMGCSFGSNAAADGPATRSTEEVLAIEGAIGSEFKIDASYLSPNVNMASRLQAASPQFGVHLLVFKY